jgi:hypothetical protein
MTETWSGPIPGTVARSWDHNFWLRGLDISGTEIRFDYDTDGLLTRAGDLAIERATETGLIETLGLGQTRENWHYNAFGELAGQLAGTLGLRFHAGREDLARGTQLAGAQPDDEFGQRLIAYIVLRDGARLDADMVRGYIHHRLARFALPALADSPSVTTTIWIDGVPSALDSTQGIAYDEAVAGGGVPDDPGTIDVSLPSSHSILMSEPTTSVTTPLRAG